MLPSTIGPGTVAGQTDTILGIGKLGTVHSSSDNGSIMPPLPAVPPGLKAFTGSWRDRHCARESEITVKIQEEVRFCTSPA